MSKPLKAATPVAPVRAADRLAMLRKGLVTLSAELAKAQTDFDNAVAELANDPASDSIARRVGEAEARIAALRTRVGAIDQAISQVEQEIGAERKAAAIGAIARDRDNLLNEMAGGDVGLGAEWDESVDRSVAVARRIASRGEHRSQQGQRVLDAIYGSDYLRRQDASIFTSPRLSFNSVNVATAVARSFKRIADALNCPDLDRYVTFNAFMPPKPDRLADAARADAAFIAERFAIQTAPAAKQPRAAPAPDTIRNRTGMAAE